MEGELIHRSTEAMRKDNEKIDDVDEVRMSYWGRMSVEGDSRGHSMESCKFGWFTIYYNHVYHGKRCLLPWQTIYVTRVNDVFVMLSLCIHICKAFIYHITNRCKSRFTCYVFIFTTVHSQHYLGTHLNYLNSIPSLCNNQIVVLFNT